MDHQKISAGQQYQPRQVSVTTSGSPICPRCSGKVYFNEEKRAIGKIWHKKCFTCARCKKSLDSTSCNTNEEEIYCNSCHKRLFGPKGYGIAGVSTDAPPYTANKLPVTQIPENKPMPERKISANAPNYKDPDCCLRCGTKVYFAEEVRALSRKWHKLCFKCGKCNRSLEPGKCNEHEGDLYCSVCYGKNFGPKGYGFSGGAGNVMNADDPGAKPAQHLTSALTSSNGQSHAMSSPQGNTIFGNNQRHGSPNQTSPSLQTSSPNPPRFMGGLVPSATDSLTKMERIPSSSPSGQQQEYLETISRHMPLLNIQPKHKEFLQTLNSEEKQRLHQLKESDVQEIGKGENNKQNVEHLFEDSTRQPKKQIPEMTYNDVLSEMKGDEIQSVGGYATAYLPNAQTTAQRVAKQNNATGHYDSPNLASSSPQHSPSKTNNASVHMIAVQNADEIHNYPAPTTNGQMYASHQASIHGAPHQRPYNHDETSPTHAGTRDGLHMSKSQTTQLPGTYTNAYDMAVENEQNKQNNTADYLFNTMYGGNPSPRY